MRATPALHGTGGGGRSRIMGYSEVIVVNRRLHSERPVVGVIGIFQQPSDFTVQN